MGKSSIRKRVRNKVEIRITEDPNVYGIPVKAYMMERLCKCGRGVMRPSGRTLVSPDGKGQTFIHACTFEGCSLTGMFPNPWPAPDMVPMANAEDPNIVAFMRRARDHRDRVEAVGSAADE